MAKVPLKLRMDIRDQWEKGDCAVQKSIAALKDLLGLPVNLQLDFPILWSNLEKFHPDQSTFVPSITEVVKSWTDCLAARLADDANAAWTEQLLEHVNQGGRSLKARVETRTGNLVKTDIAKTGDTFIISIPESSPPYRNVSGSLTANFEELFTTTKSSNQPGPSHAQQGTEDEDWATVILPSRTHRHTGAMTSTALPSLHELPRPEILFASQAPYHLIVKVVHDGIVVQGSHQGSLELLAEYFQKYTRNVDNVTVKRPIIKSQLQASLFGYGGLFDCLTLTSGDSRGAWVNINPVLILSFVESVLGYTLVESKSGGESQWYFKREGGFRK